MTRYFLQVFFAAFIVLFMVSCSNSGNDADLPADIVRNPNSASGKGDKSELPVITFEKDFHDFGNLRTGERVRYSFKFRNTGKTLLVISSVTSSCGCTVSDFPRQPIKPGDGGTIDVSFNSEGRRGIQNKSVTVFSNTQPPTTMLRIKAMINDPDNL